MKCPKCAVEQDDHRQDCESCGIIFAKFFRAKERQLELRQELLEQARSYPLPGMQNPLFLFGRFCTLLMLAYCSYFFVFSSMQHLSSTLPLLHLINTPFHEAGHLFFSPLGDYMGSLGGTLGQLLMPLICIGTFYFQSRDLFGAAVCLWWLGQNFHDIAPYINDARSLSMPLLGGNTGHSSPYGFHDWEFLLNEIGWLSYDHIIAATSFRVCGTTMIITALISSIYLLMKQYSMITRLKHR